MASHLSLRRWFNFYNRTYFGGRLSQDTVLRWEPTGPNDAHALKEIPGVIQLDPAIKLFPRYMRILLLHEMAHLAIPQHGHGKYFHAEIERLWQLGAFRPLLKE
jgi:hypothetical protein